MIPVHGLRTLSDLREVVYWSGGSALCACPRYDSHPYHTADCSPVWRESLKLAVESLAGTQERRDILAMCDRSRSATLTESTLGMVLRCAGDSVRAYLWRVATSRTTREEARKQAAHLLGAAFGAGTYCACEEPDGSPCGAWVEWPQGGEYPDVCPAHLSELLQQSTAALPECAVCGMGVREGADCWTCRHYSATAAALPEFGLPEEEA